jgi:exonuclease SbcC
LTINGHDHVGFDTVYHDNKIFANPGSPFRLSANKNEMGRMPKVMLVNIDENGLSVQDVYLKCAKKGEEVLSDEAKRKAANEASAMAKIQTLINQSSMKKGLRIADVIENIGNVSNIDKDVVKDVQNRIIESMNEMQPPFHPSGEYYITRVELENFLSHKNSAFDFTPGLNILSGESRSGKSAVLRALREVMTCYIPQPRKAIFFSASYFAITVYTSNGYIVKRKVERDEKKGFNGYEIYDPTTGVNTSYNTKAVSIVQEILGYSRIPLTEKKFIDVNSVIQGDGWFFVGNGISAPDKARLLGVVYGTHYADAANKEIASEIKKTNAQISLVQKEKERLDDKMREYAYLPKLEQDINDAESLLEVLEKQEEALASMKELYNKAQPLANEIAALKKNLAALSLDNAKAYAMALKEKGNTLNLAKEKFNNLTNIVVQGRTFRPVQRALTNIQTLQNDCNGLKVLEKELLEEKEKYNKYVSLNQQSTLILNEKARLSKASEALVPLQEAKLLSEELSQQKQVLVKFKEDATKAIDKNNQLANLNKTMERDKGVLKAFENMPSLNDLKALSNQKDVLSKAKEKQVELDKVLKEKELQTLEYSKAKKKNLDYIEEYKKQLEELGTCPICHSSIDADLVNHLVASHLAKVNS